MWGEWRNPLPLTLLRRDSDHVATSGLARAEDRIEVALGTRVQDIELKPEVEGVRVRVFNRDLSEI